MSATVLVVLSLPLLVNSCNLMEYVLTLSSPNKCRNDNLYKLRVKGCRGHCYSESVATVGRDVTITTDCKCCQISEYKKVRFPYRCRNNGRRFFFTIASAVSCHCQKCDSAQFLAHQYKSRRSSSTEHGSFPALNAAATADRHHHQTKQLGRRNNESPAHQRGFSDSTVLSYKEVGSNSHDEDEHDNKNNDNSPGSSKDSHPVKNSSKKTNKQNVGFSIMR